LTLRSNPFVPPASESGEIDGSVAIEVPIGGLAGLAVVGFEDGQIVAVHVAVAVAIASRFRWGGGECAVNVIPRVADIAFALVAWNTTVVTLDAVAVPVRVPLERRWIRADNEPPTTDQM